MISARVEGLSDLANRLKELDIEMQTRLLAASTAAAAGTVRKEVELQARAKFTERTGTLFRSIYVKRKKGADAFQSVYFIGIRKGKRYQNLKLRFGKNKGQTVNMDAFYAGFLEFGTKRMARHPFMRPAFETKKMDAVVAAKDRMRRGLQKYGLR